MMERMMAGALQRELSKGVNLLIRDFINMFIIPLNVGYHHSLAYVMDADKKGHRMKTIAIDYFTNTTNTWDHLLCWFLL